MLIQGFPTSDKATSLAAARRDLEGTVVRDAAGKLRAGIFPSHTGELVARRPDMKLDILDFRAVQDKRGACFIANEGTMQSPAFAAAPAANRRIDVLYVTQKISTIDGGTTEAVPLIVTGNASPTPVRPALPAIHADAIPLYAVEIPAGATSMQSSGVIITPIFPYTATAGGTVYLRNPVELAAWKPADGAQAHCLSDTSDYVRRGGEWVPAYPGGMYAGTAADGFLHVPHGLAVRPRWALVVARSGTGTGASDWGARMLRPTVWDITDTTIVARYVREDTNAWLVDRTFAGLVVDWCAGW